MSSARHLPRSGRVLAKGRVYNSKAQSRHYATVQQDSGASEREFGDRIRRVHEITQDLTEGVAALREVYKSLPSISQQRHLQELIHLRKAIYQPLDIAKPPNFASKLVPGTVLHKDIPRVVLPTDFGGENGLPPIPPISLRDVCMCSTCVDPSNRQRNFLTSDIPLDVEIRDIQVNDDHSWTVEWTNDIPNAGPGHTSTFSQSQLREFLNFDHEDPFRDYRSQAKYWKRKDFEKDGLTIGFETFMTDRATLKTTLQELRKYGLAFVKDVPPDAASVKNIAERLGPVKNTFYGETWDVKSKPQAKNVAYTSKYLGFHMDLLYMKDPPGFQLLHCIKNSCSGGESRFADTFKAVQVLESGIETAKRDLTKPLKTMPMRWQYDNDGYLYSRKGPTMLPFRHNTGQLLRYVHWSPPFQGGLQPNVANDKFVEAANAFAKILEREDMVYETKMDEGVCVIFENQRVVHARNAFDVNSGERWLRGAYVGDEDVRSTLRVLEREDALKEEAPEKPQIEAERLKPLTSEDIRRIQVLGRTPSAIEVAVS